MSVWGCVLVEYRTNKDRAMSALERVVNYGEVAPLNEDMLCQWVSDLVCDIRHLCDVYGLEWEYLLERADRHYVEEVADESHCGGYGCEGC